MFLTTRGLVLREVRYKESDKILTVLTREEGKLTLKARGCRRKNSRLLASSQLLVYSELAITQRGEFITLAEGDPLTVVNNLSTFIFSIIRAIGLILLGWGIVQVGLSLQSHDPSQRSQGFLTLAGGIIITFAKEILDLIVGTGV